MPVVKNAVGLTLYPADRMSLSMLSDADRGRLLLTLLDYADGVDTASTLPPQAQMAFAFIASRVADEMARANHRREVNRTNATRRWSVREGNDSHDASEDG